MCGLFSQLSETNPFIKEQRELVLCGNGCGSKNSLDKKDVANGDAALTPSTRIYQFQLHLVDRDRFGNPVVYLMFEEVTDREHMERQLEQKQKNIAEVSE